MAYLYSRHVIIISIMTYHYYVSDFYAPQPDYAIMLTFYSFYQPVFVIPLLLFLMDPEYDSFALCPDYSSTFCHLSHHCHIVVYIVTRCQ